MDLEYLEKDIKIRTICRILQEFELYPLLFSTLAGGFGAIIYNENYIYGFTIFAWSTLLIFITIVILFVYLDLKNYNILFYN